MKNRLMEYLRKAPLCGFTVDDYYSVSTIEKIADHLLANGVIVPPVKIGQTVYVINTLFVSEYRVEALWWDGLMFNFKGENDDYADECSVFYFFDERIGKTVFLTREEAEAALAERSK